MQIPFQKTIAHVARVSGRGYWTGKNVSLTFLPAEPDTGIVFRRVDLPGEPTIPALAEYRSEAQLRTKLVCDGASVEMVEHVLAALYGMGIDNCIIESDAAEMPAMDGSAYAIALAIEQAGRITSDRKARTFRIGESIRLGDQQVYVQANPCEQAGLTLVYHLDYGQGSPIPSSSSTCLLSPGEFLNSIAPARTFLTQADATKLQQSGVAQHVTHRDLVIFGDSGPIDNQLRFPDECSRHKLLDLIGDLALCGYRLEGLVYACRSGHNLNGRMAEQIRTLKLLPDESLIKAA
ncbi:MAG: UDP-3-O-acyl-N-acetylglucosamine deacetylase [Planctomycetaceae bacterium]|jgi:UDP-3-O-[3-hydroxymyristoyl] N-acetylglucosamine deacetylase|nr:UDP-3-O-acyl-N-acetylglucosamine deacetylase [Planctomycetaceae bacterium]MCE2812949.1 UDP-3-O-acyl-N-acetylglucosamine deacetylase [Planctomycetaceae bacterium]